MLNKRVDKNILVFSMFDTLMKYKETMNVKESITLGLDMLTSYLQEKYPTITLVDVEEKFYEPLLKAIKANNEIKKPYSLDDILNNMLKAFGEEITHEKGIEALKIFSTGLLNNLEVNKEAYDVLKTCKDYGYKIAIIGDSLYYHEVYQSYFEALGLSGCIDHYFFSYEDGLASKDESVFAGIEKYYNVMASEIIMIGNNLKTDIKPADKLAWETLWINDKEEDNYLDIANVKELSKLVDVLDEVLVEDERQDEADVFNDHELIDQDVSLEDEEEDDYDINNDI